eukprot:15045718-Alexandrium_andersonii.AAC.1
MRGLGPWVGVRAVLVSTATTPPRIAPGPVVLAVPETGAWDPARSRSIRIRGLPDRVVRSRLKPVNGLGQLHDDLGEVLRAVDLDLERVPEA